jgi:hypothetical protein
MRGKRDFIGALQRNGDNKGIDFDNNILETDNRSTKDTLVVI